MNNSILLTGIYKGINNNKLLLEISVNSNNKIINLKISNGLKKQILDFVKSDINIGVKGYIDFSDELVLVATKIFLLQPN
ncbi:MAG: hypothetical protein IJR82_01610 [Bacilli bacterium]|nr:hypothetical protein [Bacilli bacterium]